MAFDWFRVDWALVDHPKVFLLAADLGDPNAGWYVIRLWSWLARYAARGRFKKKLSDDVELACGWRGDRGRLLRALADAGWVENVSEDELEAHDWWDKQRAIVEKAEKDSARKRRSRSARVRNLSRGQSADKRASGAGTRRDGRDETRRDETHVRATRENAPPPSSADEFWIWFNGRRRAAGHVAEHPPRDLSGWWSGVLMELNGDIGRAQQAAERFLEDTWAKANGAPFAAFRKSWPKYASEHYGKRESEPAKQEYVEGYADWSQK